MRISYRFIQGDGTIQNYPFNSQGLFDYKAYYQGMLYYYKNSAKKNSNISKKYFDKLYKMYVEYYLKPMTVSHQESLKIL